MMSITPFNPGALVRATPPSTARTAASQTGTASAPSLVYQRGDIPVDTARHAQAAASLLQLKQSAQMRMADMVGHFKPIPNRNSVQLNTVAASTAIERQESTGQHGVGAYLWMRPGAQPQQGQTLQTIRAGKDAARHLVDAALPKPPGRDGEEAGAGGN